LFLDGFNFVIHQISGKANPADAPSRWPNLVVDRPMIPAQSIACWIVSVNDVGGVIPRESAK
jgi:hypothetical protein